MAAPSSTQINGAPLCPPGCIATIGTDRMLALKPIAQSAASASPGTTSCTFTANPPYNQSPPMRGDQRLAHAHEPRAEAVRPHALRGDARAFDQQQEFVGQHLGLGEAGATAQRDEGIALAALELLDHGPRGVLLLG